MEAAVLSETSVARPREATQLPGLLPVSRRLLLSLYLVVPVGILVPLLDRLVLDGAVQRHLPTHPDAFWFWTLIFNVPHLVASALLLLDREYLTFYRRPIRLALVALAVLWLSCFLVTPRLALWISTAITTYHVLGQQVGIIRMMGGGDPGPALIPYRLLAVLISLLAFNLLTSDALRIEGMPRDTRWLAAACWVPLTLCAVLIWRRLSGWQARTYLLANQLMFLAFFPLTSAGYGFFFALMPRVVHDLSAFAFYIAHDTNRNRTAPRGLLYKALGFTRLPAWVLLPSVSVGIGYVLSAMNPGSLLQPVALISLFHYIMEAVTWRRGGLHRKSIALS